MILEERVGKIIQFSAEQIARNAGLGLELGKLYSLFFGGERICIYCIPKIDAVINKLKTLKTFIIMKNENKARLKDGKKIRVFGSPVVISNENLTDKMAVALLKQHPILGKHFDILPDMPEEKAGAKESDDLDRDSLALKYEKVIGKKPAGNMKASTMQIKIDEALAASSSKEVEEAIKALRAEYEELSGEESDESWGVDELTLKIKEEKDALDALTA